MKKILFASFLLPVVTFAQEYLTNTSGIIGQVSYIVSYYLIPIAFSLAVVYFFYGVAKYISSAGDKEEGKKIMFWGVIAIFVMSSIWGLVYFIRGELGVGEDSDIDMPTINYGDAVSI